MENRVTLQRLDSIAAHLAENPDLPELTGVWVTPGSVICQVEKWDEVGVVQALLAWSETLIAVGADLRLLPSKVHHDEEDVHLAVAGSLQNGIPVRVFGYLPAQDSVLAGEVGITRYLETEVGLYRCFLLSRFATPVTQPSQE